MYDTTNLKGIMVFFLYSLSVQNIQSLVRELDFGANLFFLSFSVCLSRTF